jgi:hypothetical protein
MNGEPNPVQFRPAVHMMPHQHRSQPSGRAQHPEEEQPLPLE